MRLCKVRFYFTLHELSSLTVIVLTDCHQSLLPACSCSCPRIYLSSVALSSLFCSLAHIYPQSPIKFCAIQNKWPRCTSPYNQQVVGIDDSSQAESCPDFLYLMFNFLNRRTVLECLTMKHALSFRLEITYYIHLLLWISVSFLGFFFLHLTELILYQLGILSYFSPVLGLLIWICLVHLVIFYTVNDNLRNYGKDQDAVS